MRPEGCWKETVRINNERDLNATAVGHIDLPVNGCGGSPVACPPCPTRNLSVRHDFDDTKESKEAVKGPEK